MAKAKKTEVIKEVSEETPVAAVEEKETKKIEVGDKVSTSDLIDLMKAESENGEVKLTKKELNAAVGYLKTAVCKALSAGADVKIPGFILFQLSYRAGRSGFNIATNSAMDIPDSVVVGVKAGSEIKNTAKNLDAKVFKVIKKEAAK